MDPQRAEIPPPKLISALRGYNLLPAIVFLPTRRRCDEAASEVALDKSQKGHPERLAQRKEIFDEFAIEFPEVLDHKHSKVIVNAGVAAHHAGHIPSWKLLIEKMMSSGLLNALFATSTVAAGVDFPARTVVITNADTRGNDGWRALTASELQQMTGRAGRRGRDNVGFVVLAPGQFQNPKKIAELLKAPPDALESRFRATYTSLLNLLDAFGNFEQVREIAEKSFAFRESRRMSADSRHEDGAEMLSDRIWEPFERRAKVLDHFEYLDFETEIVTESGKWLADLRIDRPLLVGEALKHGTFDSLSISEAAGLMASVASDADRSYGEMRATRRMTDILANFEDIVVAVSNVEWKNGVEPAEEINYSAAAAAERWTAGMEWDELVDRTRAEEGDLVRLLSRTGEALRQLANLRDSNPAAAAIAQTAADAILREPVR
ncbi:MAG: helicase-related protein [Pyrinomonadaceae bacterium]